jgi:crotonobetainyl-CoA:carnitine CoA-transferase CaiB-like acyl-CoA transferase
MAEDPRALLDGLTVVELGDGIAGSVAAATFSTLGATVRKGVPERRRHLAHPPAIGRSGDSALVATLDRSKQLASEADARAAAPGADIVLLDVVEQAAPAPETGGVLVTISSFGLDGPDAGRPGGELVAAAAGGLLGTLEPEGGGRPVSPPGFVALRAVGAVTALAALHGLDERRHGGRPVHVDVSAQEAIVFTAALPECAHMIFDCPGRAGSGRYVAPSGAFPCRDGLVRITAVENHQWQGMVAALGEPGWSRGLEDRPARAEHADMITSRVAEWTAGMGKLSCADLLQRHGVPATPVNRPDEVIASEQLAHRGSARSVVLDDTAATVLGPPWRLRLEAAGAERPPGLRGLRVVELTHVLAGPVVGAILGGIGATVVRLEDRDRLDIYRRSGPFAGGVPGEERGAYFAVANHSKASVAADGGEVAAATGQLLSCADVLVENVGASRLDRLGVDAAHLARSGLLVTRVSGFGSDGPLAGHRAYANNVQAFGGLAWMTRDHEGELARFGSVLADPLSSVIAATVVAAWASGPQRRRGGVVDLAMVEVLAGCIAEYVAAASTGVALDPPLGNDLAPYAPHGAYTCAAGRWVAVAVQDDDEWAALVGALGAPDALDRPGWRRAEARFAERHLIDHVLDDLLGARSADEVVDVLTTAGVRASVVARGRDLVGDGHLARRGFFPEVEHPDLGVVRIVGLPWRFAGGGPIPLVGAPALGSTSLIDALERFRGR